MALASAVADTQTFRVSSKSSERPRSNARGAHQFGIPLIQALLGGEIGAGLVITQPLQVTIEQDEDGSYIVSDEIFLVYGDGETRESAILDYASSLIDFYKILVDSQDSPFDQRQLQRLREYLKTKS